MLEKLHPTPRHTYFLINTKLSENKCRIMFIEFLLLHRSSFVLYSNCVSFVLYSLWSWWASVTSSNRKQSKRSSSEILSKYRKFVLASRSSSLIQKACGYSQARIVLLSNNILIVNTKLIHFEIMYMSSKQMKQRFCFFMNTLPIYRW